MIRSVGLTAILCLGFLLAVLLGAGGRGSTAGQYALVQAEYPFVNLKGEEHWSKALFKIDTVTGELFVCGSFQLRGGVVPRYPESVQITRCKEFEEEVGISDKN